MVARHLLLSTIVTLVPSVLASLPDAQITAPARLEVRATSTSPNFIGYASAFGTYSPLSCGTAYRWTTVADYGKCCSTAYNNCDFATACKSGSILMYTDTSITCTSLTAPACVVDWVVNDLSDQRTISWIGCDAPRAGSVYVRATTSTTTSISITSPSNAPAPDIPTVTTIPSPSSTPPSPDPAPKKSNIAVIVGAAVGGLAVLAILAGLLIWILLLKKKNKKNNTNAAAGGVGGTNNFQPPPAQYQQQPMQQQQQQYNNGYFSPEQQSMPIVPVGSPPPVYPQEYKTPVVSGAYEMPAIK